LTLVLITVAFYGIRIIESILTRSLMVLYEVWTVQYSDYSMWASKLESLPDSLSHWCNDHDVTWNHRG